MLTFVLTYLGMRKVVFYKTESGKCPVEGFLDSLSSKQAQKAVWVLSIVEELDSVPSNYLKKLVNTDDIWEVRVNCSNDIFRFLGFFDGPNLIILNHAFQKKTQKTPHTEIKTAEERKKDYLRRRHL